MPNTRCEQCGKRVAWISTWTNLLLVILKISIGITSGSKACIADGLQSASNIISAFAIMLSQRVSRRKKNSEYHYGYGKFDFLAAGFTTLLIIAGAVTLVWFSIKHLIHEPSAPPHMSAVLVALISILANEMLFRYMRCVGSQLKSQSILANAWANRADCFSSIAVIIGVIGAKMGFHYLDPLTALIVVAIIIKLSYQILLDSVRALMDYSVNDIYGKEISEIVSEISDIRGVANIMTRQIGRKVWAELDIQVDPHCSIQEAQRICEEVKKRLLERIADLENVLVNSCPLENEPC